jgi:hypothetical protein
MQDSLAQKPFWVQDCLLLWGGLTGSNWTCLHWVLA